TSRGNTLGFDVAVQSLTNQGRVHGQGMPRRVTLYWRTNDAMLPVQAGQVWRWTVRLQSPVRTGNPGGFDAALWLLDKGVRATGGVGRSGGSRDDFRPSRRGGGGGGGAAVRAQAAAGLGGGCGVVWRRMDKGGKAQTPSHHKAPHPPRVLNGRHPARLQYIFG